MRSWSACPPVSWNNWKSNIKFSFPLSHACNNTMSHLISPRLSSTMFFHFKGILNLKIYKDFLSAISPLHAFKYEYLICDQGLSWLHLALTKRSLAKRYSRRSMMEIIFSLRFQIFWSLDIAQQHWFTKRFYKYIKSNFSCWFWYMYAFTITSENLVLHHDSILNWLISLIILFS